MLPNTSLIGAPSILMRVGSFSAIAASTETPSFASRRCRANAIGALVASSDASSDAVNCSLAGAIVKLLKTLQLNSVSRVVKPDDIFLLDVGGAGPVDERRQTAFQMNRQGVFVRDQLSDGELGRGIQSLQAIGFEVLSGLQRPI